jgi:hypothetical protein
MIRRVVFPGITGIFLAGLLLAGLKWQAAVVLAEGRAGQSWLNRYRTPGATTRYVWEGGANAGDCSSSGSPCETIQYAVNQSDAGDEIRIAAGTYNQINNTGGNPQVVYINKAIILWGGFTESNWNESDPENNPTVLDADFNGRVIYLTGSENAILTGLQITHGFFEDPEDDGRGGGIYIDTSNAVISQTIVEGNHSQGGGGIWFIESTGIIYDSVITENNATYSGGGLLVVDSTLTATGNTIIHNDGGQYHGGGIDCLMSSCSLYSNTISFNESQEEGAGIWFDEVTDAEIVGNWIEGNDTIEKGGGIYLEFSPGLLIQGNTLLNNEAFQSSIFQDTGDGGGIYVDQNSSALILENIFEGNLAAHGGGINARSLSGETIISENVIYSNTASEGCGGGIFAFKDVSISNNALHDNSAGFGGGICLDGSNNSVQNNQVISNHAVDDGGGIFDHAVNLVNANNIQLNTADNGGGAYITAGTAGGSSWSNNFIARNQAFENGSGVYIFNSITELIHNTIASNWNGDGSGIFLQGFALGVVTMENTVIVSQTVGVRTIPEVGLHDTFLEATLWGADGWENGVDVEGFGVVTTGTINIYGNPLFLNPPGGDFHIGAGSPAIDAGIDAGVSTDFDGESRPFDGGFDIGADEYVGEPTPTPTATPSPTGGPSPTPTATPSPTSTTTPGAEYRIYLPAVRRED